jgi:hypothetical protein
MLRLHVLVSVVVSPVMCQTMLLEHNVDDCWSIHMREASKGYRYDSVYMKPAVVLIISRNCLPAFGK